MVSLVKQDIERKILSRKKNLKNNRNMKNVWINEDLNMQVKKQQHEARSVVKLAIRGHTAKQKGVGLVIDGVYYPHTAAAQLPPAVKLAKTKTRIVKTNTAFMGHSAPLSNTGFLNLGVATPLGVA